MKKTLLITCASILACIILLAGLCAVSPGFRSDMAVWAKDTPLKVFFNDKPSQITPVESGGKMYIPVYLPVEKGETSWDIKTKFDPTSKTLKITRTKKGEKLRAGETPCDRCSTSGKCQACYPAGSGKNIQSDPCAVCNGTGKCQTCNGAGKF
ncbi:MAG: hypothetical protein LWY06_00190 [Firmicutes bacterium]|nr:hypothetical protein [Bacillota bacterium]